MSLDAHRTDEPFWSEFWHRLSAEAHLDPALSIAAEQGFVMSPAECARVRVTRAGIRTRVGRGDWTPAGHGFVAPFAAPTAHHRHALRAAAAARRRPDDAVSARSAAVLVGLPVARLPDRPQLTLRQESLGRGRPSAARCLTGWLPACEIDSWYGVPVTTPTRTLVDLGRHDRFDAIMAADAALALGLARRATIEAALERAVGWPGVRQARAVLALADARSESPLESVARLRLHDDGFPPPQLQFWIEGYRVDFCWPERRFVLEVDGRVKYRQAADSDDPLWREKRREQVLRRAGYHVERVIASDIYRNWPSTSRFLQQFLPLARRVG